jgi:aminoglycoside phosphotransferase (APT) family kinase protein
MGDLKLIARGRRSKIYDLGDGRVVKLYDRGFPVEKIKQEYAKTLKIFQSQVLTVPEPLERCNDQGREGIIFTKVNGISLMELFQRQPWLYFAYTKTIVALHKKINTFTVLGLPSQQDEFTNLIMTSDRLGVIDKDRLIKILNKPYRSVVCHGDFHHGNIIKTQSGYCLIDWMDAFSGCYLLDVALTAVNAMVSDAPPHIPKIYSFIYEVLKRVLKLDARYLNLYGVNPAEIREYLLLAAAIHLVRSEQGRNAAHQKYYYQDCIYDVLKRVTN